MAEQRRAARPQFKFETGMAIAIITANVIAHGTWIFAVAMGNARWCWLYLLFIPYFILFSVLRPFFESCSAEDAEHIARGEHLECVGEGPTGLGEYAWRK